MSNVSAANMANMVNTVGERIVKRISFESGELEIEFEDGERLYFTTGVVSTVDLEEYSQARFVANDYSCGLNVLSTPKSIGFKFVLIDEPPRIVAHEIIK